MLDFLSSVGSTIITPLYYLTSAILLGWHWLFSQVLDPDSGWTWAFSIIGLTVTIRAALIPLFVRQIKASRNMQLIQPKVKDLQKKYGHDRERLAQETMKLYKDSGTNPFASCLPILAQAPIFLSLFRLIDQAVKNPQDTRGLMTVTDNQSLDQAEFLGVRISDTFTGATSINAQILTVALILTMTATTFITQRQLFRKNMPESALTGPYAQQQKILLYVLPLVFAVGGIAFPVGVIIYWTTSNLWTMGQQFYVIRNNPAPGTPAFKAKQERDRKHGRTVTDDPLEIARREAEKEQQDKANRQRQQPKKKSREKRKKGPSPGQQRPKPKPKPDEETGQAS